MTIGPPSIPCLGRWSGRIRSGRTSSAGKSALPIPWCGSRVKSTPGRGVGSPSRQAQAPVSQTIASECRALEVIVTGFRAQTPQVDYLNRLATQVIEEHRRAFQSYPDLVSSGRANQANWNRQLQVNRTRMDRAKVAYDSYYNQVVGMAR
jgi:hypothetical protein